jgi:hypothetical protein
MGGYYVSGISTSVFALDFNCFCFGPFGSIPYKSIEPIIRISHFSISSYRYAENGRVIVAAVFMSTILVDLKGGFIMTQTDSEDPTTPERRFMKRFKEKRRAVRFLPSH